MANESRRPSRIIGAAATVLSAGELSLDAAADPGLLWAVLSRAPGVLWVTDTELTCQFASRTAIDRLGLCAGRPISATLASLPAITGSISPVDAHRRALDGASEQYSIRRNLEIFNCVVEPLRDPAGRIVGVVGSADDVTVPQRATLVLRDQQHLLETTLQQAADGIAIADAHGRLVFFNPAARRIANKDPEGTSLAEGTAVWGECLDDHERLVPVDEWPIARALRGEVTVGLELHKYHPDGSVTYIQISATPVRDAHDGVIGAVATFTDITGRKLAETQLRALNEELEQRVQMRTRALETAQRELEREITERREITESLDRSRRTLQVILDRSTAVIYVKDTEGRYQLINHQYERLFELRNGYVVGKTDYDIFPTDVAARLRANDERVLRAGEPLQFEEVVPQSDGSFHAYLSAKFPLRDEGGPIYALCGISTDITERKAMEAELRRSEALLSAVIESSTDAIFAVDAECRLIASNAAVAHLAKRLTGAPLSVGASVCAQLPGEAAQRAEALLARALAGERVTVEESLTIDDTVRHFLVALNSIGWAGGISGVTVFAKDITELKRAEEQARQHQAELAHALRVHTMGEMAASLAHEINQPLGAIANYAQGSIRRLRAGAADRAELMQTAEEIAREALRAGAITRRVREILRKGDARREAAAVNTIVTAALDIVAPIAHQRSAAVRLHPTPGLPAVEVDRIQIEQVVINLLLNAIEAIDSAGHEREIDVHTALIDHGVQVSVRDAGVGLDPKWLEKIFEPFFTTKADGLGMGLAISRSIIEAHGGRLWASANETAGTTFSFTLPAE